MNKIEKNFKNKAFSLFVAVLLLSSAILLMSPTETVNAQSDDLTAKTTAFLSIRPTTLGVGQELLINMWITPAPGAHRQYHDMTLIITKPDGSVQEISGIDTYVADGTAWMPFVPDQVGEWSFKLVYPGEYFASGIYVDGVRFNPGDPLPPGSAGAFTGGSANYNVGVIVQPASSRVLKLTVQEEIIPSWPEAPLPTDYWKRPVNEETREWWPILGDYPWFGPGGGAKWDELYPNTNIYANPAYAFTPWVKGPESAHIAWKREYTLGGLLGGDTGSASSVIWSNWYNRPTIILAGKGYQAVMKPAPNGPGEQTWWQCYDIRTGEIFWERPLYPGEVEPTLIEYGISSLAVPGVQEKPSTPFIMSISNGYLRKYEPIQGHMVLNVSIAPMTGAGGTYYMNGHVLGIQDLGADAGAERYRLINWTTFGIATNFTDRIISNTTYARNALPTGQLTDWEAGVGATITSVSAGGIYTGVTLQAFDLITGVRLWNKTVDEPQYSGAACVADHGKLAVLSAHGYYVAYDLRTGREEWRTRTLDYPWDEPGWGSYSVISAYNKLYWVAQSGIYAIDWDTGAIDWKFEIEAPPFETVYTGSEGQTVYPFHAGGIGADGKIYIYSCKHSPEQPFYRGSPTLCIDAFTGELIWELGMSGAGQHTRVAFQIRVAEGYLALGARDGWMYVIGKGLSETTISAQETLGKSVLLTGSILDLSPAQPGAPCVSKESMNLLMTHLHMQTPIAGIYGNETLTGVPVSLDAVDENGDNIHIGVVTTEGYSGTFGYTWTPDHPGQYTITATFMGDESYGSSFATSYVTVSGTSATTNADDTDNTLLYAVVGVGIAIIAVVLIVGFLILRKKP